MKVSRVMAGFTRGQSDSLRKACGKKDKVLLAEMKNKFIDGCVKNNIDKEIAQKIFEQIEYFGDYGFNKCLGGDTMVFNKEDGQLYSLEELAKILPPKGSWGEYIGDEPFILDSYIDGKIVEDEMVEVFETGEKEIYEVELDNGMIIKCTLDHKFYCSDGQPHTIKEIMEKGLEILYEENGEIKENMLKCEIKSIKLIGRQMTYNVTMKGNQHNYKIVTPSGIGIYAKNSHSCAYAYIAYQTAWLKMYFPLEFMSNLLTSEINNNDKNEKLDMYIAAAERMKIGCSDPDINQSGLEFKIGTIVTRSRREEIGFIKPLTFMKGVGDKAVRNIVQNQPYRNLEDFIRKTDSRIVNSRVFSTLVNAGCMSCWKSPSSVLLHDYPEIKKKYDKDKKDKKEQDKDKNKMGGKTLFDEFQSSLQINV